MTRGLIHNASREYERAIPEFQRALQLEPGIVGAYLGLADAYDRTNRAEIAESTYREALKMHPDHWPCYNLLGSFYFAHSRYENAAAARRRMTELWPDHPWGHSNLGAAYMRLGNWDEAIRAFQHALEQSPKNHGALSNLATAFFSTQRYEQAVETYQRAYELNPGDYVVCGNLAAAYSRVPGKKAESAEFYRRAAGMAENQLKVNPRDQTVLSQLAIYYASLGENSRALDRIEQATAAGPDKPEVCYRAVQVCEQLGQRERALQWVKRALDLTGFFSLVALFLACLGLYGVITYSVARRTGEIGIRLALGANRSQVMRMVLRDSLLLVTAGIMIGIPGALVTTRFASSLLFGLEPTDPHTLLTATLVLFGVAMLAG